MKNPTCIQFAIFVLVVILCFGGVAHAVPSDNSILLNQSYQEICVVLDEQKQFTTNEQGVVWSTPALSGARGSTISAQGLFIPGNEVGTIWIYANKEDAQLGLVNVGLAEVTVVNREENCRKESNVPDGSKWHITGFHEKKILHYDTSRLIGYRTNIDVCVELKGTKLVVINGSAYSEISDTLPYCDPVSIIDNDMKINFIVSDGLLNHNILSSFLLGFDKEPVITWHCVSGDLPEHTETEHCVDCIDNMNLFPSITAEDGATSEYVLINDHPTTYDDPYAKSSITITKGCGPTNNTNPTDNNGTTNTTTMPDFDEHCKELIPGHNSFSGPRANIVFVAAGADSLHPTQDFDFVNIFTYLVNGTNDTGYGFDPELAKIYRVEGLKGIEPFKSNQDKFNYWYIDVPLYGTDDPCNYIVPNPGESCVDGKINGIFTQPAEFYLHSKLMNYCNIQNNFVHLLYNPTALLNPTTSGEPASIADVRLNVSQQVLDFGFNSSSVSIFPTFVHEFTHSFADVFDEKGNYMSDYAQEDNWLGSNCFSLGNTSLTTQQCSNNEALPWYDLIGNGCGEDGVVDCSPTTSYISPNSGESYATRDDEWVYEVKDSQYGCGQGCLYIQNNIFRPYMKCNIMSSCDLPIDNIFLTGPFTHLGVVNEREACRVIRNITGDASDYCQKLCLDGCAYDKKCIMGVCTFPDSDMPTCISDNNCLDTEYCSSGNCIQVIPISCGQINNHRAIPYECGSEPGCSVCASGSCSDHKCVRYDLPIPENAVAGTPITIPTIANGSSCSSCDIQIIDSNGVISTVKTDSSGKATILINTSGRYSVVLLKDGVVLANNTLDVAPSPNTIDFKNILGGSELLIISLVIVIIIVVLVFLYLVLTRKKKQNK